MITDPALEARRLFDIGVAAADPYAATQIALNRITLDDPLILAIGKAATRMAEAAMAHYAQPRAIIVTNPENARDVPNAQVFAASHPVPDGVGLQASAAILKALAVNTRPVLALISGGGSALLPAPVGGIPLADKARVNELLLASGADIVQTNLVRQHLSRLKGGGLNRHAAPQPVTALILSDVIGGDLRAIASGPTVSPIGTAADARAALQALNIWDACPATVQRHLLADPPTPETPSAHNILIGSNTKSLHAMRAAAPSAKIGNAHLVGDVAEAAKIVAQHYHDGPGTTLFGGETTVQIKGTGAGGRNQELALRVAKIAAAEGWENWTYLQGGTDGRDGPTDAAGGVVNETTLTKIRAAGHDPDALLANNDSYAALKAGESLLMTGGTGTNVADLGILIRT
ncbi:glycerate kinase [Cognatishimia sp. MH4019]|uniref:glycerate kinase type-2 family protein n=1 Tax=Cognatishimia sp. MH4019 TaxID=2854030 RepID=UPI001CD3CD0D|nr:DUF4147 domain-containing protein [Cognatishimia sp. MH4019]